jgi:acetyl esterase/lipase
MNWNPRLVGTLLGLLVFTAFVPAADKSDAPAATVKKQDTPKIPPDLVYLPDQLYCMPDKDVMLLADILMPKGGNGPNPAVVCMNGGGWVKGSRKTNLPIMIKLAEAGYVAVSVQYRLAQEAPFPAAINDVKCAIRWLRANAGVFNIDPDRIGALGYSSGGNMACLLGLTKPLDGLEGEGGFPTFSSRVQVVVSYAGISDLAEWYKDGGILVRIALNKFMKDSPDEAPKLYAQGSPMSYVRGNMAAVLLIHGTKDEWVPLKQSEKLKKALENAKANVQLLTIKDSPHDLMGDAENEADAATLKFLDENLRSKREVKNNAK